MNNGPIHSRARLFPLCVSVSLCCVLPGCSTRTLEVTSDPPGATVVANDVELGRTPLSADFTYYGSYDVLVTKPGYEPLRTTTSANTPFYEYPPIDLAAAPARPHTTIRWHFVLTPAAELTTDKEALERELINRARALRDAPASDAP